jgi:hypothetical protein
MFRTFWYMEIGCWRTCWAAIQRTSTASFPFSQSYICGRRWGWPRGLTKDLFTSVCVQILQTYFRGESAVVPFLLLYKHSKLRCSFIAIGRNFPHTVALLKLVPTWSSCSLLLCLLWKHDTFQHPLQLTYHRILIAATTAPCKRFEFYLEQIFFSREYSPMFL